MAKKPAKIPDLGVFNFGGKEYRLAPFTTRRFELVGALVAEIPLEPLLEAYWQFEAAKSQVVTSPDEKNQEAEPEEMSQGAEREVEISLNNIIKYFQQLLPAIAKGSLLVKFVSIALDIPKKEAENLPAFAALEVVRVFFTANSGLLGTSLQSSLYAMYLTRQATTSPKPKKT